MSVSFLESPDLHAISKLISFSFFRCTVHYGPNFAFSVRKIKILILLKYFDLKT